MPTRDRLLVPGLMVAIIAIACAAVFLREAAPTPPLSIAGLRLALASGLLVILGMGQPWARAPAGVSARQEVSLRAALIGGVLYAIHFGAWVASLWMTTLAASTTLVTASPLFLAVHGLVTGRDAPSRTLLLWLVVALSGVVAIGVGTDAGATAPAPVAGNLLALVGALAMAGYLLLTRSLGPNLDVRAFSAIATGTGGTLLLGLALVTGDSIRPASLASLGWIALAAAVPQVLGHSIMTWAMKVTTPTVVGLATLGEPIVTTALGVAIYAETPTPWVLAGCGLTLVAVVGTLLSSGREIGPLFAKIPATPRPRELHFVNPMRQRAHRSSMRTMPFVPAAHVVQGATPTTTVFVLHGILANNRNWRTFARRLVERRPDLRLVLVDHRGHGESRGPSLPPPHDLDACARDLEALAELHPPHAVVGHSFGGKVAVAFAQRRGRALPTWSLDAPLGRGTSTSEVDAVLRAVRALPSRLSSRSEAADALRQQAVPPSVIAWMDTNLERAAEGGWVWRFDVEVVTALMRDYRSVDLWPWASVSPGVHVVRGLRSDRWSPADVDAYDALPPDRRHDLDAGHWVHVDAPDALLELLARHLPTAGAPT